jgi:hypothetical protein
MRTLGTAIVLVMLGGIGNQQPTPQVYRATFDYYFLTLRGDITHRQQLSGTYTRDRRKKTATWTDVTAANADGTEAWEPAEKRAFMEGFTYPLKPENMTTDAFFHGIPLTAMQERNLVFDTRMLEIFGEDEFDHLQPNTPYHFLRNSDVPMAGAGTFSNKDAILTLTGKTVRGGTNCAVVDYVALFNTFELTLPNFAMRGRSNYWGQVWISLKDKQIEHATLYEDVLGDVTEKDGQSPTNVFRIGTLDRVGRH